MNRKIFALILAALMLMTLAACKTEEEPTITTFEDIPGVALVPEDYWDDEELSEGDIIVTLPKDTQEAETDGEEAPAQTTDPAQEETEPADTEQETQKPTESVTEMTQYEWYHNLSGEEQMAFMESFDSMAAFFDWYNAAKAEHEQQRPSIDISDGNIDLGDLIGGNG